MGVRSATTFCWLCFSKIRPWYSPTSLPPKLLCHFFLMLSCPGRIRQTAEQANQSQQKEVADLTSTSVHNCHNVSVRSRHLRKKHPHNHSTTTATLITVWAKHGLCDVVVQRRTYTCSNTCISRNPWAVKSVNQPLAKNLPIAAGHRIWTQNGQNEHSNGAKFYLQPQFLWKQILGKRGYLLLVLY